MMNSGGYRSRMSSAITSRESVRSSVRDEGRDRLYLKHMVQYNHVMAGHERSKIREYLNSREDYSPEIMQLPKTITLYKWAIYREEMDNKMGGLQGHLSEVPIVQ